MIPAKAKDRNGSLRASEHIRDAAARVFDLLHAKGARQVRIHAGRVLTYPADAPRGYGVHGELVGIYDARAQCEWITEDISLAMSEES